ncbi:NAD-dependent histone deacetylase sir2 [Ascosphaera pollenicola]|nr:NAD-dependent histone deacetylase sir2 [Ascosphaera pollenicola]
MDTARTSSGDASPTRLPAQNAVARTVEGEGVSMILNDDVLSDFGSELSESESDVSSIGSLYWETYQSIGDDQLEEIPGACTLKEALAYRELLRKLKSPKKLVNETVGKGMISLEKLCTAFRILPPPFFENAQDDAFYKYLMIGIDLELSSREKLPHYNSVDDAVNLLKTSKNIVVLTGAGISTSLGIPDFRSKNTGLYSRLEHLGLNDPQEVFDIQVFREDPTIFYSVAGSILPSGNKCTPTHAFIRLLQDKGKLLTNYTQNIDNLEGVAGILPEKLIQCHGSFATASCILCGYQVPGEAIHAEIRNKVVPQCPSCLSGKQIAGIKRKRTSSSKQQKKPRRKREYDDSDEEEDCSIPKGCWMKPDITFFGEDLHDKFEHRLENHDCDIVDLVIVIGTSLKVAPVKNMIGIFPKNVPQIFINRDPVDHLGFDIDLLGNCDTVVAELCRRAGWDLQHEMISKNEKVEVTQIEGHESQFRFTALPPSE